MKTRAEIIGWIGMVCLLGAYFLNANSLIASTAVSYLLMNFFGGVGTAISAKTTKNWPVFVLESMWALIALVHLIR